MNCRSCPYFHQSPTFPKHGRCKLLGGDFIQANHPQCGLAKRLNKAE